MSPWRSLPQHIPLDQSTVWVRIHPWFGAPFLAVWDLATRTFSPVSSPSLSYPFWVVARWRPQ